MNRGRLRFLALVVTCAAIAGSCANTFDSLSDAATITFHDKNGTHTLHVDRRAFDEEIRELTANAAFSQLIRQNGFAPGDSDHTDAGFAAAWLNVRIQQAALFDADFHTLHLQVTPADRDLAQQAVPPKLPKDLANELIARQAREYAVERDYFTKSCPSGRLVSHILLRTHADAEAAFNQIRGGASFESVATAKSIDTQSAQNGGILGCLQPGEFVPAFEQAAETVPFDTVTVPVQSQFGYHLILVRHWSTDEVGQQWRQIAQQEEAKVYGPRLASMTVHIDPRYGSWQKGTAQQAPRVVPPVAPEPREARDASTPTS